MSRHLLILALFLPLIASAQFTLTGPQGMINVPHAEILSEGTFMLGMHTNEKEYFLLDYGANRQDGDEYVSSLTIGFLERVNVSVMLTRIFGDPKQTVGARSSIGDRSVQVTALLFKGREMLPSIVLNITDPLFSTSQYLAGNHLVATKTILAQEKHLIKSTLGYGFSHLAVFRQGELTFIHKRPGYLRDLFGGLSYQFLPINLQVSLEYDGWALNSGIGVTLFERVTLQTYLQGMKHPGLGFNYVGTIH